MDRTEPSDLILKSLNAGLKSKKLYPPGHPAITTSIKKGHESLNEALKAKNNIVVALVNDALVFEEDPVMESEKLYPELMQHMAAMKVEALIFERGHTEKELAAVIDILASKGPGGEALQKELHSKGVTRITMKSVLGKRNALEVYNGAVEAVKNVMAEIRMGKIPKAEPVNSIVTEMSEIIFTDPNAILGLTMIKNYDNYLFNHSVNVSVLALSLGKAMNLSEKELHAIGVGALLHDVGKTGVSEQIIRKPGGLSSEEWEKIKQHPQLGSNIIKRMEGVDELVERFIFEHHVRFDRSGYPEIGHSTHPLSQIITICDAYDALTTLRVYQQPHNPVEAMKLMMNFSGRHFNPDILKAFINMMGLYPIGTMVRLSTNEIGVVTKINPDDPERPSVKLIHGTDGAAIAEPYEIDLSAKQDLRVTAAVNPVITNVDLNTFFEKEAAAAAG